jgi:hypothetical protein
MKKDPHIKGKEHTNPLMWLVAPLLTLLMGTLTFVLAFIYGKELRTTLAKNQKELRVISPKHKKVSLS